MQELKSEIEVKGKVCLVLTNKETGKQRIFETENLITDNGDLFYAYRMSNAQPTDALFTDGATLAFDGIMELGSAGDTPAKTSDYDNITTKIASSQKAMASGYPKRNDTDVVNTGKGTDVVTYKVSYGTSEANGTIDRVFITNPSPSAGENLLCYAVLGSSVVKTSSDTLDMYINHTPTGA